MLGLIFFLNLLKSIEALFQTNIAIYSEVKVGGTDPKCGEKFGVQSNPNLHLILESNILYEWGHQ